MLSLIIELINTDFIASQTVHTQKVHLTSDFLSLCIEYNIRSVQIILLLLLMLYFVFYSNTLILTQSCFSCSLLFSLTRAKTVLKKQRTSYHSNYIPLSRHLRAHSRNVHSKVGSCSSVLNEFKNMIIYSFSCHDDKSFESISVSLTI